jgi:hypothetical protein
MLNRILTKLKTSKLPKSAEDAQQGVRRLVTLSGAHHDGGACFFVDLSGREAPGDDAEYPQRSDLVLFEDGTEVGPAHSAHDEIRGRGAGRYSHWGFRLYFSATDNSDPRSNGRSYTAVVARHAGTSDVERARRILATASDELDERGRYLLVEALARILYPTFQIPEFGRGFLEDQMFARDFSRLEDNRRSLDRKYVVSQLVKSIAALPGDTAECGVFRGATSWFILDRLRSLGASRPHHLFDSFEGVSAPTEIDGTYWTKGDLAAGVDVVKRTLHGFDDVHYHPGWIPDRFDAVSDRRFSFVHIDVDLYEPTFESARFFYERLTPGGIMVCDDYGFSSCPGARKAFDDALAGKAEPVIELPTGQGFVIKR